MIILSIDPGVAESAQALIQHERLIEVGFRSLGAWLWRGEAVDLVVVERPEYQGARSDAARTQDLLALSWAGAKAAYSVGVEVREVTPREWKGSTPKPVHHLRLWEDCLNDAERKLFAPDTGRRIMQAAEKCALRPGKPGASYYGRWDGHNLLDAAALGLAFVGRFR